MKAIRTYYLGPTNYLGSRCKATDEDGNSVILPWDSGFNSSPMHRKAAQALCDKMRWRARIIGGGLKDCMVWVFADSDD